MSDTGEKTYKFLDGTVLKLIAMVSMVFDHVGDNFFPGAVWMRVIGRMAMPLFSFCVAEGYSHTRDPKRYLTRMLLFGAVSEIPFDLVTAGKVLEFSHQNIMFTFALCVMGLICCDMLTGSGDSKVRKALGIAVLPVFAVIALLLGLDYNMLAVVLVSVFYLLRRKAPALRNLTAMTFHAALRNVGIYWFGLLGFIPIFFYNGEKGRGLKWLFYLFYPGHLLVIWLIRTLLS